jgi:CRISPR-associated protein Csd1
MILQALDAYYHRKMADPNPARRLPVYGFEDKEIPFVIDLMRDGRLVAIKDTRVSVGKKKVAARYLVPKGVKKTSGVAANLLWDTAEYVLGVDSKHASKRVAQQHAAFRARIDALPRAVQSEDGILAVRAFLDSAPLRTLEADSLWDEIRSSNPAITFRLSGDLDLICQRPAISGYASSVESNAPGAKMICLVTGESRAHGALTQLDQGSMGCPNVGSKYRLVQPRRL